MKRLLCLMCITLSAVAQQTSYNAVQNGPGTSVMQFGADATGNNSSTVAATNAIIAVVNSGAAGTVFFPCGTFKFTATVSVKTSFMLRIIGNGGCTKFVWAGNSSSPMWLLKDCTQCEMADFQIIANSSFPLLYGIQMENSGSGTRQVASLDRLININMEGGAGYITTGVFMGGGTDGNNDQQYLESVVIRNYLHSAYTINHSQIYDVVFNHCGFAADGFGSYGVENLSGNFHWIGYGTGGGNQISDFYIGGVNGGTDTIESGRLEGSPALLTTAGPAYNPVAVTIRDVNWAGDKIGCTAMQISTGTCSSPPGGYAITFKFLGPLVLDGDILGTFASVPFKIYAQAFTSPAPNLFSVRSTVIVGSLTTTATIFDISAPTDMTSSAQYNPGTNVLTTLFLSPAVAPITLPASATIDVTGYPQDQLFISPNSGSPSYDTITGMYDGYQFFVGCRNAGNCIFTANTHNIQFNSSLSPLTLHFENTAMFKCFAGVCSLVTAQ